MDTKLTGDIAVQHAVLEGLKRGWGVMLPVGDRLPYDLVYDVQGRLIRVQTKSAYRIRNAFVANTRRAKTNRKNYRYDTYKPSDFDVAMLWHPEDQVFYLMPITVFLSFKSSISLPGKDRKSKHPSGSDFYRDNWAVVSECGVSPLSDGT